MDNNPPLYEIIPHEDIDSIKNFIEEHYKLHINSNTGSNIEHIFFSPKKDTCKFIIKDNISCLLKMSSLPYLDENTQITATTVSIICKELELKQQLPYDINYCYKSLYWDLRIEAVDKFVKDLTNG